MYSRFRNMKTLPTLALIPMVDQVFPPEKIRINPETGACELDLTNSSVTGWDKVKAMFTVNDFQYLSPPLSFIGHTTCISFSIAMLLGGATSLSESKATFIQNYDTVQFQSVRHARRFFKDMLFYNYLKAGFKFSLPFCTYMLIYTTTFTVFHVYRGDMRITDHFIGASLAGAFNRFSLGPRAVLVGGLLSGLFGTIAGTMIWITLKLSGSTMNDVWKYSEWINEEKNYLLKSDLKKDEFLRKWKHYEGLENISIEEPDLKETSKGSNAIPVIESNESGIVNEMKQQVQTNSQ